MMNLTKCYKILDITGNENLSKIKRAFIKAALKYHPDKTNNDLNSNQRFIEAREAYDNIMKFKKLVG
ncbi:MAG: hypothetical protein CMD65_04285 [Gammaproteobacteria bacterium]|nr:hypothetical protein [Gammaproteobacteria bacterium]|tara:strand:- start:375 stop:575 length:201 start_codon:yes stop_codon:yes gene_type:complete